MVCQADFSNFLTAGTWLSLDTPYAHAPKIAPAPAPTIIPGIPPSSPISAPVIDADAMAKASPDKVIVAPPTSPPDIVLAEFFVSVFAPNSPRPLSTP